MAFFSKKQNIYLDWASSAPVLSEALEVFNNAAKLRGNPSSPHKDGVETKNILEEARTSIARLAQVKSRAVIFTSGATEANALAIQGRIKKCIEEGKKYEDLHVLYLPTMHSSARKTMENLKKMGVHIEAIPLVEGKIDLDATAKLLRPETILVCTDAVCGETGIRFDTLRIRRVIDAAKLSETCALFVDASQLPLIEPIDITRLGASMLTLDAQKVGGVRGIGVLIIPKHSFISPITYGGGQEFDLRPGTEPVALIATFARALELRAKGAEGFKASAAGGRAGLLATLTEALPHLLVNEAKEHVPHILNLSFPGIDTDYAIMLLDARGFSASTRSACEADSEQGSEVIQILTGDTARASSTLRISWGPETPKKDLKKFAEALISTIRFLEANTI